VFVPLTAADDERALEAWYRFQPCAADDGRAQRLERRLPLCAGRMDVDGAWRPGRFQVTDCSADDATELHGEIAQRLSWHWGTNRWNVARLDAAIVDNFSNSVAAYQRQSFSDVAEQAGVTRQMVLSLSRVAETDGRPRSRCEVGALLTNEPTLTSGGVRGHCVRGSLLCASSTLGTQTPLEVS
jgi:hypothetical protein